MAIVVGKDESMYKRVTCRNCASIVQYAPNDVKPRITTDYTGSKDMHHEVVCPCCLVAIVVSIF